MNWRGPRSGRVALLWLTGAHAVVDAYALLVPFLLPILAGRFAAPGEREAFAGLLAATIAASTSLGQVLFAFLADRLRFRWFVEAGLFCAAVGLSLLFASPSRGITLLLALVGGLGVAAFHPPATVGAARASRRARGLGMAVFITGGNLGQAVGPLAAMALFERLGARLAYWAMLPGLLVAFSGAMVPYRDPQPPETRSREESSSGLPIPWLLLSILFLVVTLRTVTLQGFLNFLSLYLDDLQLSHLQRSGVLSGFIFCGSMGMLLGGSLSDRLPRLPILFGSMLIPVPLFWIALRAEGVGFVALLLLANFLFQFSTPLLIVLGQDALPARANLASSLVMGAAWGTAGLLNYPVGLVASWAGLPATLSGVGALPWVAALLFVLIARRLPPHVRRAEPVPSVAPPPEAS
ncbi:MAG: MFS transporter [Candidatus Poribacteria bacterium]|nr:MAG: MFS transporter [Candidatus Poribacteria bacterium]